MLSIGEGLSLFGAGSTLITTASASSERAVAKGTAAGRQAEGSGSEVSERGTTGRNDPGLKAYEQAAQRMGAGAVASKTGATSITDTQTNLEIMRLKAADAAVRAHEAAHVAAGGSYVRGAANYTFQQGPDGKQYAVAGEVSIDISTVAGDPQATILKMITVRAAALAPADPSAADRAVAAAAAQKEAAARAELSEAQTKGSEDTERPKQAAAAPDAGQAANEITEAQARQVQATYGASGEDRTASEPQFRAAA